MAYTPLVTYTMVGYQTTGGTTPGQAVYWNVTGTPDLTGAKSPFPNAIYNISIDSTTVSPPPNTNVLTPTSPAGGDLNGYYPNPTVQGLQGVPITTSAPADSAILTYNADEQELLWVVPESDAVTFSGDLSGNDSTQTVVGIRNTPVVAATVKDGYVLTVNSDGYYQPLPSSGIPDPGGEENGDILFYQGGSWNLRHIGSSGQVLTTFEGSPTWENAGIEIFRGGSPVESSTSLGVDNTTIAVNNVSGVPTLSTISSPTFGITYPAPPVATNFTALGAISAVQSSNYIIAKTVDDGNAGGRELLLPLPNGVSGSGPFVAVMVAACQFNYNAEYPGFGLVITDGYTGGTSPELWNGVYMNANEPCVGVWKSTLQSTTRSTVYLGDNTYYYTWPMQQLYFRTINDGYNIIFQYSNMGGYNWRTSYSNTISNLGLATITNYGISMGAYVGTGWGAAVITALNMAIQPRLTITNITQISSNYSITTSTPHGLSLGDDVSIVGVPGGSAANAVYTGGAVNGITSTTTFTLIAGSSITTQTSGFVTILSQ